MQSTACLKTAIGNVLLAWRGSFARQANHGNNPLQFRDDYSLAELTGTVRQYAVGAGFEVLKGDGVRGFATPIGTYHRFDGWADKFAITPPNGLERRYVSAGYHTIRDANGSALFTGVTQIHEPESDSKSSE